MYTTFCALFVTIGSIQFINGQNVTSLIDGPIVYPGPIQDVNSDRYGTINNSDDINTAGDVNTVNDIPDECKKLNFCTIKPKNYPQEEFNALFSGMTVVPQPNLVVDDFDNRQGDPEERDDCDVKITLEPLYSVKSLRGDWRTVIQAPENNYIQKVRLETCRKQGGKCFNVFPSVPGFVTSCKQKYNIWEVLVKGENGPETIKAELPVCCSCTYRASSLGGRSGFS